MTSHEQRGHSTLPVYEIVDVAEVSPTLVQDQDRAHTFAWYHMQDMLGVYVDSPEETAENPPKELVYWLALERQLAHSLEIEKVDRVKVIGNAVMTFAHAEKDLGKVVNTYNKAGKLSSDQVHEYFYKQLSQYRDYLTGGPQQGLIEDQPVRIHDSMHYVYLAEALQVGIWHDSRERSQQRSERLWEEIVDIAHLFLDANKINLAINYLALAPNKQAEDEIIQRLAAKLCEDPMYRDTDVHAKMYQQILHALPYKRQWGLFIEEIDKRQ